jgi:hypothetical protein
MNGIESFKQLEPSNLIEELLSYLESELMKFPHSKEFAKNLIKKKNENQHSSAFCLFMTNRSDSRYYFERETSQKGSSTIDIGVYFGSTLIYTIEAKVLPTPKGTRKNLRFPYEYVYGKGAGIQRFKDENHGLDHANNLLSESGMIAYIKEKDFDHWHTQVNDWIKDATWSTDENLEIIYLESIGRLKSKHIRKNRTYILLHHFWIKV